MKTWAEVQAGLEGLQEALSSSTSSAKNVGEVMVTLNTLGEACFWGIPIPQTISDWVKETPPDLMARAFMEAKLDFDNLQEDDDEDAVGNHFEYCSSILAGFLTLRMPMVEPSPWGAVLDLIYTLSVLDEEAKYLYEDLCRR